MANVDKNGNPPSVQCSTCKAKVFTLNALLFTRLSLLKRPPKIRFSFFMFFSAFPFQESRNHKNLPLLIFFLHQIFKKMNMNVYHENQTVEIFEGPLFGSYWPATVVSREKGHRFNDDDSPLTEVVHVRVIRLIPPEFVCHRNFEFNDIVDIGAWQAGTVIGNVENLDHHLVRLFDQTERLAPYIRFHAEQFPLPCYVFWRPTDEYTHNPVTDPQPSATD